jgi:hypothetical protein
MIVNKITTGYVLQQYDTEKGEWICQEFVAGDPVIIENIDGEVVDCDEIKDKYLPFTMLQPVKGQK